MKIYYFENRGFALVFDTPGDGAELAAKARQNRCIRTRTYGHDRVGGQVLGAGRMPLCAWTTDNAVVGIWAVVATSSRAAKYVMAFTARLTNFVEFEISGDGERVQPPDIELLAHLSAVSVPDVPHRRVSRLTFDRGPRMMAMAP